MQIELKSLIKKKRRKPTPHTPRVVGLRGIISLNPIIPKVPLQTTRALKAFTNMKTAIL